MSQQLNTYKQRNDNELVAIVLRIQGSSTDWPNKIYIKKKTETTREVKQMQNVRQKQTQLHITAHFTKAIPKPNIAVEKAKTYKETSNT